MLLTTAEIVEAIKARKSRHSEVLASFVKYCLESYHLRFWQALLNWSGLPFIVASGKPPRDYPEDIRKTMEDTYFYEGRNS